MISAASPLGQFSVGADTVGPVEGWKAVRQAVCHPAPCHGRGDRLADVLQLQEIALDAGIRQIDEV